MHAPLFRVRRRRTDSAGRLAFRTVAVLALVGLLNACHREDIAAYEAPKDSTAPPAASADPHGSPHGMAGDALPPRPGIAWNSLPDGWTSRGPSGMRAANFTLSSESGGPADLAVIPLPGTGGSDVDLVNLWRGQLSLEPISPDQLPQHTEETTVGNQPVKLFSIVGSGAEDAGAAATQILVAALRKDGFTWFFKLSGDAPTVGAHRDRLKEFLTQVTFTAPPAEAVASMASRSPGAASPPSAPDSGSSPGPPRWAVPESWASVPPPSMVHSKWSVAGSDGSQADVTVSVFPGSTGGIVPNLNRWRAQVGLQPAPESELAPLIDNTDVLGGKATLVDFTGTNPEDGNPKRMVGAIVERDGRYWFYKLLGVPAAVEAHREGFLRFVQSVQYPRGS